MPFMVLDTVCIWISGGKYRKFVFLTIHFDSQPLQGCGNLALALSRKKVRFSWELASSSSERLPLHFCSSCQEAQSQFPCAPTLESTLVLTLCVTCMFPLLFFKKWKCHSLTIKFIFQMCNSVIFWYIHKIVQPILYLISEHFKYHKRNTVPISSYSSLLSPSIFCGVLPSISVDLPSLDTLYKWNHTIYAILFLACFT